MTRVVLFSLAAAALASSTRAQPVFRARVEVVRLDVSVTRGGTAVVGLTARDFLVTDNGVAQDVDIVALDRVPLDVTLVLDQSGSVSGRRLMQLVEAGEELIDALRPDDRAALITFSQDAALRAAMTRDMGTVRAALSGLRPNGATALRDAVYLALQLTASDHSRPLLLLFTDGHDTGSWLTEDSVVDAARRAGVVVHVVRVASDRLLDRLVDASGGRAWSAASNGDLRELFKRALDEMRDRYLLSYAPKGVGRTGWHEIKVKLRTGRGDVTARPGYFVSESSR